MSQDPTILNADARAAVRKVAETLGLPRLEPGWVWLAGAGPGDPVIVRWHEEANLVLAG